MLLSIIFAAALVFGFVRWLYENHKDKQNEKRRLGTSKKERKHWHGDYYGMQWMIAGVCFLVCHGLMWLGTYHESNIDVVRFTSFKASTAEVRDQQYIGTYVSQPMVYNRNAWLAQAQYENSLWFCDPYISDKVDSLTPIR